MTSWKESVVYHSVRLLGVLLRRLPLRPAIGIGRAVGILAYYWDVKHKTVAYANLKAVFSASKSSEEIKAVTKTLFKNYGQNFIDLFRMPLMTPEKFRECIHVEGIENLQECLKEGKGAIMLAMHFGSWELASLSCAMLGLPYKVIVRPQTRYSRLDELLNYHRSCGGFVVLSRGMDTRDLVRGLRNNEVIGMVADQGGKDGVLVPFFGRNASMSAGAIRMGLKWGVPICFSVIHREGAFKHRMIVHKPLELVKTGDPQNDIALNLARVTKMMEEYILKFPSEYMWFYKIWKYSDEAKIVILTDGRTGHLRQSQAVSAILQEALGERQIKSEVEVIPVVFKNRFLNSLFSFMSLGAGALLGQGRLTFLKSFLDDESYRRLSCVKADFVVSCGSSVAAVNNLLARDHNAKSIAVLNPGLLSYRRFHLVIVPQHESVKKSASGAFVAVTTGAPNLVTRAYQKEQAQLLLSRYSHLKSSLRFKIGVFIGGEAKDVFLSEDQIKMLIHHLTEVGQQMNADILVTTSRRTPAAVEQLLSKRLKKHPQCSLLICAGRDDVPEAVGGILGLADIQVVSGDSISMISEAASSGKNTVVFFPEVRVKSRERFNKHRRFIEQLQARGFIAAADVKDIGRVVYDVAKNKIQTRELDDRKIILEAVRKVI